MLNVLRKVRFIECRDYYFCDDSRRKPQGEDIQYFLQSKNWTPGATPFTTSIIALGADESVLFAGIRKNFAYDIRRARDKDVVEVELLDTAEASNIERFAKFFDAFAMTKQIRRCNRNKMEQLCAASALVLSVATTEEDRSVWLCAHAYISDGTRARLLYSASNVEMVESSRRQAIGRANKFMHWKMITLFRERGFSEYDLGGLGLTEDVKSIAEFKVAFGGQTIVEYNHIRGVSLLGKFATALFRMKGRLVVRKRT
jgi:hypothetical protein